MMKLQITRGDFALNVEGDFKEVVAILNDYWLPMVSSEVRSISNGPEKPAATATKKTRKRSNSQKSSSGSNKAADENQLDAQALANRIKTRSDFDRINEKILKVSGKWLDKCKLVATIAEEPITSGDVNRVMEQLRIRSRLPTLSTALSKNISDFITRGSNPVKYELTQAASDSFDEWLAKSDA